MTSWIKVAWFFRRVFKIKRQSLISTWLKVVLIKLQREMKTNWAMSPKKARMKISWNFQMFLCFCLRNNFLLAKVSCKRSDAQLFTILSFFHWKSQSPWLIRVLKDKINHQQCQKNTQYVWIAKMINLLREPQTRMSLCNNPQSQKPSTWQKSQG